MQFRRKSNAGFTLLEALLAAVVLAVLAIPAMNAFSQAALQSQGRLPQFENYEFAISLLTERVITGDLSPESGIYKGRFAFEVTVEPYTQVQTSRFDDVLDFLEITVSVQGATGQGTEVSVSQIVARDQN